MVSKSKYPNTRDYLFSIEYLSWAECSGIKDDELNELLIGTLGVTIDEMEEWLNGEKNRAGVGKS